MQVARMDVFCVFMLLFYLSLFAFILDKLFDFFLFFFFNLTYELDWTMETSISSSP